MQEGAGKMNLKNFIKDAKSQIRKSGIKWKNGNAFLNEALVFNNKLERIGYEVIEVHDFEERMCYCFYIDGQVPTFFSDTYFKKDFFPIEGIYDLFSMEASIEIQIFGDSEPQINVQTVLKRGVDTNEYDADFLISPDEYCNLEINKNKSRVYYPDAIKGIPHFGGALSYILEYEQHYCASIGLRPCNKKCDIQTMDL